MGQGVNLRACAGSDATKCSRTGSAGGGLRRRDRRSLALRLIWTSGLQDRWSSMEEHRQDATTTQGAAHGSKRLRGLLAGALVGLLILGGAYYFYSQRAEDRSEPRSEQASSHTAARAPASEAPASPQGREAGAVAEQGAGAPPATPGQPKASTGGSPEAVPPAATAAKSADPVQPAQNESPQPARNEPPRQPDPKPAAPAAGSDPAPSMRDQTASLPAGEVLFVQKSRANIRSQPRSRARIVASAPKGQRVEVVGRDGSWIQIRTDLGEGWMSRRLLGPQIP
jgi:hypothetical protein